jgi:hypothetical protein
MRCLLFAFAALALAAQPSAAQVVQAAQLAADPHERVYDTLVAQADDGPMIEAALDWLIGELRRDGNIAVIEAAHPGFLKQMRAATRPIIAGYSQRVKLAYRPRMIAILRAELTAEDAAEIAEFYASPVGRRLVAGVSQSYRPEAVLGTIGSDEQVTVAEVERDMDGATQAALQGLSAAETAELHAEIAAHPAMAKLVPLVPKIAALRAEMEEQPMTAEEEAAIGTALAEVFASLERSGPDRGKHK